MTLAELDTTRTDRLLEKLTDSLNGAALMLMTSIGHRTGLFDTMARLEPAGSDRIAAEAGLSERYVREWLGAMVTSGVVEFDPDAGTYFLPPEHAACLTRAASPNNFAATAQWVSVLGAVEDKVVDAFHHGKGVPYSAYNRFHEVMAEESAQTAVGGLFDHILPLVPGLSQRLRSGISVLDVGCGAGRVLIALAEAFPRSTFRGYDFSEEAIAAANREARRLHLTNVTFAVKDAALIDDTHAFDLITTFDAVHDQADPARVLANIRRALKPDGVYLMQDIKACSHVHHNKDLPLAPFIYTISTMHCMSVSLANNGAGLGAAWGKELATKMLKDAGFASTTLHELPHDPLNYYYVNRTR